MQTKMTEEHENDDLEAKNVRVSLGVFV